MATSIRAEVRSLESYQKLSDRVRFLRQKLSRVVPTIPGLPYLYISPFYLFFSMFLLFPTVYTIYLSFFRYDGPALNETFLSIRVLIFELTIPKISNLTFVGLKHYESLIFSDEVFHLSLFNTTFILLVQVPLMIGLALVTALVLDSKFIRAKGIWRTVIALPVATGMVAYSTIFLLLFEGDVGMINQFLVRIGLDAVPWMTDKWMARITIVLAITWRWMGYNMIILLAGLQTIPQQLYEAAEIDGASVWQKFRFVTIPQLRPVLLFVIVSSTIGTFKLFAEPFVITGGGPANATLTVVQYIYRQAFVQLNMGYASAVTIVLVVLVTIVSVMQVSRGGTSQ